MLAKARELAQRHGWFFCQQFENAANPDIHAETTAREILDAFEGRGLDFWVTGAGTGGTLRGVSRMLKSQHSETKIILAQTVLFMVPDTGERYLSTALFDEISEAMSEEEKTISASTESYLIGALTSSLSRTKTSEPAGSIELPEPAVEATVFVERTITNPDYPVVMFALEWCEFFWSRHRFSSGRKFHTAA